MIVLWTVTVPKIREAIEVAANGGNLYPREIARLRQH